MRPRRSETPARQGFFVCAARRREPPGKLEALVAVPYHARKNRGALPDAHHGGRITPHGDSQSGIDLMRSVSAIRNRVLALLGRNTRSYASRLESELEAFRACENVHDLPEIFHYWSNTYVRPMMEPFGFSNPNDFFGHYLEENLGSRAGARRVASIGSGNCDLEVALAARLRAAGIDGFVIDCIDINEDMLGRGVRLAEKEGVAECINPVKADFNRWSPGSASYAAVLANQSLHHVLELEHLFDGIEAGLEEKGVFLVSDMIGRNGHMRWPEALALVNTFWDELPERYRYNHLMKRLETRFVNHDCSTHGFEGIRAQDILPLLLERFHFRFFLPYGNVIFPFVDRAFGHNYDPEDERDRAFVDRVHAADEEGMISGRLTPTSMLAVMSVEPGETRVRHPKLTPEACVRVPSGE